QHGIGVERERILAFRPIEGDRGDTALNLPAEVLRVRDHGMSSPPATTIAWPVIPAESGRHTRTTASATSCKVANLPPGERFASVARASSIVLPVALTTLAMAASSIGVPST